MRELKVEEVGAVSGAMGADVGIPLVLGIMGTAVVFGVPLAAIGVVGFGAVAIMGAIAGGQAAAAPGVDKKAGSG